MKKISVKARYLAGSMAMIACTSPTIAQELPGDARAGAPVEEIIVTGTRTNGMRASDSPAPIQIIGSEALARVGQADFGEALSQNTPSLTIQRFAQNTSAFVVPVRLNGLSPNHTLVLVNGKRRHTTSTLSLGGFAFGGAASADLSYIPAASISRVEVLQNGAAAQYGSDAIAGVVNIIQKKASEGGTISFSGGEYFDGGGRMLQGAMNIGLAPTANSYINITGEARRMGATVRAAPDARTVLSDFTGTNGDTARVIYPLTPRDPTLVNNPDYPILNKFPGNPRIDLYAVSYNAGIELGDGLELYSFGSYGHKDGLANNVYRDKNTISSGTGASTVRFYPLGFTPQTEYKEDDFEFAVGLKGENSGWRWDISSVYGKNYSRLRILNSGNVDIFRETGTTPTEFLAGKFRAAQWTNTLDIDRDIDIGMVKPANLAFGLEYRKDYFTLIEGDPASYYKSGSQAFYGLTPIDAGRHSRNSKAAYVDLTLYPTDNWIVDGAARYEDYSDFGDTAVFKLTTRYDFTPGFALRGTASTGFRAPTLAEGHYSGVNTTPIVISGQLAPNSPGARLIGINGLKPEKSTNFSLGIIARPAPKLSITVDAYQITVRDRILNTGRLLGAAANPTLLTSPSVLAALLANGINASPSIFPAGSAWTIGVNTFANGLDTRTRGIDVVVNYPLDLGSAGSLDWTLAGNYNKTKIKNIAPPPPGLNPAVLLYDQSAIDFIVNASPRYKLISSVLWRLAPVSLNLRGTYYGRASQSTQDTFGVAAFRKTVVKPAVIVDAELGYDLTDHIKLAIGSNNLFNKYPPKMNALLRSHWVAQQSSNSAVQYPQSSPYGINGGFYYGRVTVKF
jgi:iron complex outermembrane receptor protein